MKSKTEAAKKVYSLGDHLFSVFNHKHFRIVCQQGLGNYNDQTCMHIAQIQPGKPSVCTSPSCFEGKELNDKSSTLFMCRHLELISTSPPSIPEKAILSEDLKCVSNLMFIFN